MRKEEMERLAKDAGFTNMGVIPADHLVFDPSLRKYCEDNLCGNFGKNLSCPPACGTPEEMKTRTEAYETAWIFQTIAEVDWHDAKALKAVRDSHNARSRKLLNRLREEGPCRFPEQQISCISAYCMSAEKMAEEAGLPYWCGEGKVGFFSLYLTGRKEG